VASADVRARLLEVATRLFSERGFAEVGIREIARAARVTPGMIAYYFGDKVGLSEAILDTVFEKLLEEVRAIAAETPSDVEPIAAFVHAYIRTVARAPWIPQFIVREVATRDGPLRARFVERFGRRAAEIVPAIVAGEIRAGRLRADLDPRLAVVSLVGMCIFPFVAAPVMAPVLGLEIDAGFPERLIAHTERLFLDGARPRERAS
jgi:AcrR family transcriptional regulator